jgi:hypothetical protein
MARIIESFAFAGGAERLTGTRACPNRSVIGPSRSSEGVAPHSDAGEEVALRVAAEVIGRNFLDRALVYVAGRDVARGDEVAQVLRGLGVELVVVHGHAFNTQPYCAIRPIT